MTGLIADIGGTNARFGLAEADGSVHDVTILAGADHDSFAAAAATYLRGAATDGPALHAAFCVASPVTGDRIELTNSPWSFSVEETRSALGLETLEVINDFTAVALSVPRLTATDLVAVGGGNPVRGAARAVLGPGTGLGVSGMIPARGGWAPLETEGGHVTMPATTGREAEVLAALRKRFDHVSAERVLSGPGLVNLYRAIAEVDGVAADERLEPADVAARGIDDIDPLCNAALHMAAEMLGTVAADLALTLGARGGVYIAGGIVPRYVDAFARSGFRRRFEDKDRFSDYLVAIPTWVVTHELPAFVGLAEVLNRN